MKTTTRKFDLSEIMHNAHGLFKSQNKAGSGLCGELKSFADCLRAAWRAAKSHVGRSIRMIWQWGCPSSIVQQTPEYAAGCAADYAAGTNGRKYFGD